MPNRPGLPSHGDFYFRVQRDGLWRPEPGAAANETQGWIPEAIMPDVPTFDGPRALAQLLANRDETRRCFVRQWLQYGSDRDTLVGQEVAETERASIDVTLRAFRASGYRLDALIVAVAQSNVLLRR